MTNRFEISKFEARSIFDLLRTLERSTKTFLIHVKNDTKFITNRKLKNNFFEIIEKFLIKGVWALESFILFLTKTSNDVVEPSFF